MSVFSLEVEKANPVTAEVLDDSLRALGVTIKPEEKNGYQRLLAVFHESVVGLMSLPGRFRVPTFVEDILMTMYVADYVPPVDEERFPREEIRFPDISENPLGAWAWRCRVEDKTKSGGLLAGKTIAIKDNIAVKGVPMLLGTDFVRDYVPVSKFNMAHKCFDQSY